MIIICLYSVAIIVIVLVWRRNDKMHDLNLTAKKDFRNFSVNN